MPTMRTAIIVTLAASLSALALALTGCSSSGSAAGGSTAGKTSAVSAGTTAATVTSPAATTSDPSTTPVVTAARAASTVPASVSAPGKLDGVPKTCPSAAEVMSKLNLTALVLGGTDPSLCQYLFHGSAAAPHVVITFTATGYRTTASFEAGLKQGQKDVKPVPGLGDAAFTWAGVAGSTGLSTISGGTVFSILPTVATTTADEIALARAIIAG